jgi:O-acetyl-ADP-ribose deacetylase
VGRLEVWQGDITQLTIDAIVNAANARLAGGGGVDGAIHAAAGPELARAAVRHAPLPAGQAVVTPAFGLEPAIRLVVHTVGPRWSGGELGEPGLLRSCYRRSLEVAREAGATAIAFPAISTGIYGFPRRPAAAIALEEAGRALEAGWERVVLVAFDDETAELYRSPAGP